MSSEDNKKDEELEQNKREKPIPFSGRVITTGFFAGVFWSALGELTHFLKFSEVSPNMILQLFILGDWKSEFLGTVISILLIGVISIGAALLYYSIFKQVKGMWMGVVYGAILWVIVFYLFNPMFPDVQTVPELKRETVITTFCIYLLYGLFVGYSISFEYNELNEEKLSRVIGESRE
ncbi:YqhR family membrane protein [Bacillus changyiensis]|uniref:YqhR family membrane protein n=1 Tax=Bacillus changyiensis TaxID=3004103 RepID=UPI0022E6027D|nr:YqhR family membrane protein [Bacillus changyiensis]MDA1474880.1 YqhR family membrane protein [Bacillus changyiensis]